MILLIAFAFVAGIVTILSPCILPILPIILSSSVDTTGKRRPLGVVVGFILSFTFFTLFLSTIVRASGIPAESLRYFSIVILIIFGLSLFVPKVQIILERLFSKLASLAPTGQTKHGFWGGIVIGLSLGLLWTPCVGPILASVISLALSGTVTAQAFFITFAYALGTAIPMFLIMLAGNTALKKVPWLLQNSNKIQKAFGVIMVLTAIGIFFNIDRQFQTYILNTFPKYGVGLTKFEDNDLVKQALKIVNQQPMDETKFGKSTSDMMPKGPLAPEIISGGEWFNSKPLKLSDLKGKVVVVDFWTYSCINCQRTLPYLREWWDKYKDQGLVIIGVHAPEFEFEKNPANVKKAIADFKLTYPIVQDNDFATWRAYSNSYWPAKYILDKDGVVRYTHFGEGEYDETEKVIQDLLKETGKKVTQKISNPSYIVSARTPETYLGYSRIENFSSPEEIVYNKSATYTSPKILFANNFAYEGNWTVMSEYAAPSKGAKLHMSFESKEVYLVMRTKGQPGQVKVFVDETQQYFGEDAKDGVVTVDSDRLYKLIKLPSAGKHDLRLEFVSPDIEVFAFTFG